MNKILKINKLTHCVVESVNKTPIFDTKKEKVLLQDKTNGNIMYVSINDAIIKTFLLDYGYEVSNKSNISKSIENSNIGSCYNILQPCNEIATHKLQKEIQEDCNPKHLDDNDTLNASTTSYKATWTHKSTLLLIDLYKKYETQFTSAMIKTEAVWKKIAAEMKSAGYEFSSGQCKDKMKYMKRCYLKKIDNMGPKSTGSAPVKCEYFDELDNLFGKKPNVQPVSVCSTSKVNCQMKTDETIETIEDVENIDIKEKQTLERKGRKRKSINDDLLAKLNSREEAKERRHLERQAIQRESITVFKNVMNELLKKL